MSPLRVTVFIGAALLASVAASTHAQTWPARPIRLVVAQSAGGNADFVARTYALRLAERVSQQIVVDNRPGGAGVIGTEIVARSAPDGYTLLMAPTAHGINPALYAKLPFHPEKDFTPISQLAQSPALVVVNPQQPMRSIAELIEHAKARPGKLHYGSSGTAGATHLAAELFKAMAGVDIVHVVYKGAPPAVVDLVSGQIEMMFASPPSVLPLVRTGRLRALATTGSRRAAFLPDLPTVAEAGVPGYQSTIWQALFAPARLPANIQERLHREVAAIARQPDVRERLANDGSDAVGSTPQELAAFLSGEIARWTKVIKSIGLKVH